MKTSYDIVIIGGGISGASIAYHLAKEGVKNIAVLEKSYQGSGATSRCGAGIRQQWGTEMNCALARYSCEYYENAVASLDYQGDIEFKQGGYLMLASTEAELEHFKRNVMLQNSMGIKSRSINLKEAKEIVPFLNTEGLTGASYYEKDGHLNPFTTLDSFVRAGVRLGVDYLTHTEVLGIEVKNHKIRSVLTNKGKINTETVVNAAGGYSKEVGQMAGIDIPTYSERHEILVTTPVNQLLKPMVMSFSKNIYTQQVPHGSIIMGRTGKNEPRDHNNNSTWSFLEEMAKTATELLPPLKKLRVVRSWAGQYNLTPDKQPIYGKVNDLEGYFLAVGFSGHGFMFAPATGSIISKMILDQNPTLQVDRLNLERFKNNKLVIEPSVV